MSTDVRVKDPFDANMDCIHCGFCLPKCPTYQILGNEADSPRGRIYLMQAVKKGKLPLDEVVLDHLECCLGCRACESACPSGVRYELMLNETRARIYREEPPSALQRLAFRQLLPYPWRLAWLGRLTRFYQRSGLQRLVRASHVLQWIAPEMASAESKLPVVPAPGQFRQLYSALGERRYRVGFLSGCVMPVLFPHVHQATIELLRHSGCEVVLPPQQGCCGALHSHGGDQEEAQRLAVATIEAFGTSGVDAVVINSAGCGAAMKEYPHLLEGTESQAAGRDFAAKVKDILEFLSEIDPQWQLGPLSARVAYDDPCHLLHGQQVSVQPRQLLGLIPELTLLEVPNSDRCCGSAGIYNLVRPDMSEQILEKKVEEILGTDPERVATANPGCLLQIQYGLRLQGRELPVVHPVELLFESLQKGASSAIH